MKNPERKCVRDLEAGDEARTRYLHLGKVALYRMSYTRRNVHYYSRNREFVKTQNAKK